MSEALGDDPASKPGAPLVEQKDGRTTSSAPRTGRGFFDYGRATGATPSRRRKIRARPGCASSSATGSRRRDLLSARTDPFSARKRRPHQAPTSSTRGSGKGRLGDHGACASCPDDGVAAARLLRASWRVGTRFDWVDLAARRGRSTRSPCRTPGCRRASRGPRVFAIVEGRRAPRGFTLLTVADPATVEGRPGGVRLAPPACHRRSEGQRQNTSRPFTVGPGVKVLIAEARSRTGHDRRRQGSSCRALRDAGLEVVYTGAQRHGPRRSSRRRWRRT